MAEPVRRLNTGEGRILVAFTVEELAELVIVTNSEGTRERLLCAIGLLDAALEAELREAWSVG
jgi:hypothetical protein